MLRDCFLLIATIMEYIPRKNVLSLIDTQHNKTTGRCAATAVHCEEDINFLALTVKISL